MFGYLSSILGAALALSALGNWIQHKDNEVLSAKVATYQANETALVASNKTKDDAITVLGQKLGEAAGLQQQIELARDGALAALNVAREGLAKAVSTTKTLRSRIYAQDVASRIWAFSPVPDALGRQLCDQWTAAGGDAGPRCGRAASTVRGDSGTASTAADLGTSAASGLLAADCSSGCFSNDQLRSALDSALTWGGQCVAQLRAIGDLTRRAVEASTP